MVTGCTTKMGRREKGEGHHFAKLTEKDVREIRKLLVEREKAMERMNNLTFKAIARRVSREGREVSANAIWHIAHFNSWKGKSNE